MTLDSLLAAGSNARGQLASGSTEDAHSFYPCKFTEQDPGSLPKGTQNIINVACGANHTLLLLQCRDGSSSNTTTELWGCGDGSRGQLGANRAQQLSNLSTESGFQPLNLDLHSHGLQGYCIRMIAASWETSYVVMSSPGASDVLLSMGADDFGDLGIGGKGKALQSAVHVVKLEDAVGITRGDEGEHAIHIRNLTAGPHHVVVRVAFTTASGVVQERLVGWGTSRHGQLGLHKDPTTGRPIPFLATPHLLSLPLEEGGPVVASALGTHHTVLLHASGRLSGIGSDRKGQLAGIDTLEDVSKIGCTWNGTYAVVRRDKTWSIMSVGSHNKGQLGRPRHAKHHDVHSHPPSAVHFPFSHETHELVKMVCGSEHILCLFTTTNQTASESQTTEVWGWGWNEHGNLGIGNTQDQDVPVKIWPSSSEDHRTAVDIWAGYGTSWIFIGS